MESRGKRLIEIKSENSEIENKIELIHKTKTFFKVKPLVNINKEKVRRYK